jgi:hypothetical protein
MTFFLVTSLDPKVARLEVMGRFSYFGDALESAGLKAGLECRLVLVLVLGI